MSLIPPIRAVYDYALQPLLPFSYFDIPISTLDVLGALRLCIALRQIREANRRSSLRAKKAGKLETSYAKDLITTLLVVYGGEAIASPLLGIPPSFMISGTFPLMFAGVHALVEFFPSVPSISLELELPFSVLDGFTRAFLLCSLVPPTIVNSASPVINSSPWTLLLTSLIMANGGFFLANLLSCFHPTPLTLTTPPELLPYGWTAADIWCAPLVTGLYALLTHAQPFWGELHGTIATILGSSAQGCVTNGDDTSACVVENAKTMDGDSARAICAVILSALFVGRTVKNFAGDLKRGWKIAPMTKDKTQ